MGLTSSHEAFTSGSRSGRQRKPEVQSMTRFDLLSLGACGGAMYQGMQPPTEASKGTSVLSLQGTQFCQWQERAWREISTKLSRWELNPGDTLIQLTDALSGDRSLTMLDFQPTEVSWYPRAVEHCYIVVISHAATENKYNQPSIL